MSQAFESVDGRAVHLLLRFDAAALDDCRRFCRSGDAVVLLDTGVLSVCREAWREGFPDGVSFACLEPDARAQGVADEAARQGLPLISDPDLARLVADTRHCLSWK